MPDSSANLPGDCGPCQSRYVLIHTQRRDRKRFPDNCVTICGSEAQARARAEPAAAIHAAVAMGPSRSSEGIHLFYLVRWLD